MNNPPSAQPFIAVQACLQQTLPMARIEPVPLPELPQVTLGLINADFPTGPLPADVMRDVIAEPAYWAFCWGSGLATAQWLLAQPELVHGKQIADLGCGSGIVAIAAALAGAEAVWAIDIDPAALAATAANAEVNQVELQLLNSLDALPVDVDILYMADVLYDRSNFALIEQARQHTAKLVIADSRVTDLHNSAFALLHTREALTYPNLGEFDEFRTVRFFASPA
ncbi:MAG: 50S ribosomal protein L11 methyltransferase [Pseudomonadota bacterium]